ncbi:glycosyltransferase [Alteromonas sp.]|jgi:sugar transferase (PEP-CTERM/EpsH1 system associated)|uniref:glycosyltransferase n=1 Tax=Alteromonas sp. TaxID=232 RepID=UPI00338D61F4
MLKLAGTKNIMTKKVVHVVYSLHIGGLERVLVNTIRRMPATFQHTVVCLTEYSDDFARLLPTSVEIKSLGKKAGQDWSIFKKWAALLRSVKPDVVHTFNLATLEMQVVAACMRVPVRIHAEHGRDIYDPKGLNKKYWWLRRLVSPFVHTWVTVSGELFEWLIDTVKIPKRKTRLIRNGVDTDLYVPAMDKPKGFTIGHVGRLSPIKNQVLLVDAFNLACSLSKDFAKCSRLQIVGDGESRPALEARIKQSDQKASIALLGARSDMPAVYRGFTVFAMSSLGEGIPMTLLEAMACGIPAVVTNVGGMPEVLSDDEGFVVASEDAKAMAEAFLKMFTNSTETQQMSTAARAKVISQFDEAKMVADYLTLYNQ